MPPEFTALIGDLHCYTKHAIKTADGVSIDTYSHLNDSPVYRLGQESIVSVTGWEKLVSRAFDLHNKQRFIYHYSNPQGEYERIIGILSYVDDNNM